jgi:hypothetical protein
MNFKNYLEEINEGTLPHQSVVFNSVQNVVGEDPIEIEYNIGQALFSDNDSLMISIKSLPEGSKQYDLMISINYSSENSGTVHVTIDGKNVQEHPYPNFELKSEIAFLKKLQKLLDKNGVENPITEIITKFKSFDKTIKRLSQKDVTKVFKQIMSKAAKAKKNRETILSYFEENKEILDFALNNDDQYLRALKKLAISGEESSYELKIIKNITGFDFLA